jgi:hypothetical protein
LGQARCLWPTLCPGRPGSWQGPPGVLLLESWLSRDRTGLFLEAKDEGSVQEQKRVLTAGRWREQVGGFLGLAWAWAPRSRELTVPCLYYHPQDCEPHEEGQFEGGSLTSPRPAGNGAWQAVDTMPTP